MDTKPRSNPFKADTIFGEMPGGAMGAMGLGGNMELTDAIKEKYKPFDWSQHDPKVFGHVDNEMKPYITGQKSREWQANQEKIKVAEDPLTPKSKPQKKHNTDDIPSRQQIEDVSLATSGAISSDTSVVDSSLGESIKVYDEP